MKQSRHLCAVNYHLDHQRDFADCVCSSKSLDQLAQKKYGVPLMPVESLPLLKCAHGMTNKAAKTSQRPNSGNFAKLETSIEGPTPDTGGIWTSRPIQEGGSTALFNQLLPTLPVIRTTFSIMPTQQSRTFWTSPPPLSRSRRVSLSARWQPKRSPMSR